MIKSHVAENEKTHKRTRVRHAILLYKSMLKTAGTLCSKIKDLNSNCAEYNINLYLGYLKTNIQTLLFLSL